MGLKYGSLRSFLRELSEEYDESSGTKPSLDDSFQDFSDDEFDDSSTKTELSGSVSTGAGFKLIAPAFSKRSSV